jgi:DNA ligase-1
MAHRLAGNWEPTADDYQQLLNESESGADDPARPYPFYLAYALEDEPEELGDPSDWIIEWKWDGIRCELIKRQGEVLLWSRGEELVTDRFPEVVAAAECLPDGTVLDGELLAWQDDHPLPFIKLQQRIGRKKVGKTILKNVPVSFMAYDVMEAEGEDVRAKPQHERRGLLEKSISSTDWKDEKPLLLSPLLDCKKWDELRAERERSREFGVEGMMLKKREAHYGVGRTKGDWWKWKVDPFTCDCVMIYAQRGHGRRASLYTDYTFAVWNDGELVPVMKAYSGLTDAEIRRVDKWVRAHTLERFGPVRSVTPGLVMELAFEGINSSSRHKSGVAVRFPRISRWRHDKPIEEADTLESLKALMKIQENVKPVSS